MRFRMNVLKKLLLFCLSFFCGALYAADNYYDIVNSVSSWIEKRYSTQRAKQAANNDLDKITGSDRSKEEKIAEIKKAFPEAFHKEEKPLIFVPPVSWRIHSLALGYDIQESAIQTSKTIDIGKEIASKKSFQEVSKQENKKSQHNVTAGVSATVELPANPLSWLSGLKNSKIQLAGSYSYGREALSSSSELWSKSQQETFSRERTQITEMVQQTDIKNFHLTFTVTVTNHGKENIICDLTEAYIPVYGKTAFNNKANPHDMPERLEIPPKRNKDIIFRMELDNTNGRALALYLTQNAPVIDILKGGQLIIKTKSGKNVFNEISERPATAAVNLKIPDFSGSWNIRRFHTSNGEATTIYEALNAIGRDFYEVLGKADVFAWSDNNLTEFSSVPYGKFDKSWRYMMLLQVGNTVLDQIEKKQKLPKDGCTLWIVDLANVENYTNLPLFLKKKIYDKLKAEIDSQRADVCASLLMASLYEQNFYVQKDDPKTEAFKWYMKAAEQGDAGAQRSVGTCYYFGNGVEKNYTEAFKWYMKAAKQGDAEAQMGVGTCYYFGNGVKQNYTEAFKWYMKAAEQGDAGAQRSVGTCYYWGNGVEQNYTEAFKWYMKAAKQGDAEAQRGVGSCYYFGNGVEQNYTEAFKWYMKAAEQGDAGAQRSVGTCYYWGNGVE